MDMTVPVPHARYSELWFIGAESGGKIIKLKVIHYGGDYCVPYPDDPNLLDPYYVNYGRYHRIGEDCFTSRDQAIDASIANDEVAIAEAERKIQRLRKRIGRKRTLRSESS
jgi:hypothetical protein